MHLRFSLRTLFILTTLTAIACGWAVLPSLTAQRFLNTLAEKDYPQADLFFSNPADQFLAAWADKRWAFSATGELAPWTVGQALRGKRHVVVRLGYFEFDQNGSRTATIAATALGLGEPAISQVTYSGTYIDAVRDSDVPRR
jgi:hypothetical protein